MILTLLPLLPATLLADDIIIIIAYFLSPLMPLALRYDYIFHYYYFHYADAA